jgi:hypothetical protein
MAIHRQVGLGFLICLIAAAYVAAQDQPPIANLTFDQPLHFLSKDGSAIPLQLGTYRLSSRSAEGALISTWLRRSLDRPLRAYAGTDSRRVPRIV